MSNYNIVIFGCDGMLGSDIMEMLDYERANNNQLSFRGYTEQQCDITSFEDVDSYIGNTHGSITHVINCAAYTNVDGCEDNEEHAMKVNGEGPKLLAELCLANQIHLTHFSTDYVFEGIAESPYLEQHETNPLSAYGRSKLAGEGFVRAMGNKGLVIRTSWLYGKNGKNFIDTILNKLDLGVDVSIVDDQIGSPTYTMDLANVTIQLALSNKSGLFHACNSGECSWYDFAVEAAKALEYNLSHLKRIKSYDLVRKAPRPKYSVLSMERLNKTLPEPVRKWEDGLKQYLLETKRLYE